MSSEVKEKIRKALTGKKREHIYFGDMAPNWKGGLPECKECGKKLTNYNANLCNLHSNKNKSGNNHYNWKGDTVGYYGLHVWIRKTLGKPDTCETCGRDGLTGHKIHWANKSGLYIREITDWLRLCVSCHKKYDLIRLGKAVMPL